jgi:hypothetical protein
MDLVKAKITQKKNVYVHNDLSQSAFYFKLISRLLYLKMHCKPMRAFEYGEDVGFLSAATGTPTTFREVKPPPFRFGVVTVCLHSILLELSVRHTHKARLRKNPSREFWVSQCFCDRRGVCIFQRSILHDQPSALNVASHCLSRSAFSFERLLRLPHPSFNQLV